MNAKLITVFIKRHPVLTACVSLIFCLSFFYYFRSGTLDEKQVVLEEKSKLLKKLTTTVKNATDLAKQTLALSEINKAIEVAALKEGELAVNQQLFLRLESETGVKLVELRPLGVSPVAAGSPYLFMSFGLSVSGGYRDIITFLKRLERGPTLSRITNISLGGSDSDQQTVSLNVDLLGIKR